MTIVVGLCIYTAVLSVLLPIFCEDPSCTGPSGASVLGLVHPEWSVTHVQFFVNLWTVACQASLSMGVLQARIVEWAAIPFSRRSS